MCIYQQSNEIMLDSEAATGTYYPGPFLPTTRIPPDRHGINLLP